MNKLCFVPQRYSINSNYWNPQYNFRTTLSDIFHLAEKENYTAQQAAMTIAQNRIEKTKKERQTK